MSTSQTGPQKRDANDVLREDGVDELRRQFDVNRTVVQFPGASGAPEDCAGQEKSAWDPTVPALEFDDEITIDTKMDALVKGLLHPGDIAALYGLSGVGKTFVAMDLGYHIAHGLAWHGRRVRAQAVLYVGLEGQRGLRNRMLAAKERFGSAGRMFARLTINPSLGKSELGGEGEAAIIDQAKLLEEKSGSKVGLIIIDTTARAMAGDDENSAQDTGAYVARKHRIAAATGAAVLSLHHPGKDDARGMRGSSAFFAACDVVIKLSCNGKQCDVISEKVKDEEIGLLFSFELKRTVLGADEDGDQITSCTVEQVDADGPTASKRPKPNSAAERGLSELDHLAIGGHFAVSENHERIPDGVHLIDFEAWREACRKKGLSAGNEKSEERAFRRAVADLSAASLISRYGKWVWRVRGQRRTK
jgi:hypothetical protein